MKINPATDKKPATIELDQRDLDAIKRIGPERFLGDRTSKEDQTDHVKKDDRTKKS